MKRRDLTQRKDPQGAEIAKNGSQGSGSGRQSGIEIVEGNTAVAQLNGNVGLFEVHTKSATSRTKKGTTDKRANIKRTLYSPCTLCYLTPGHLRYDSVLTYYT